MTGPEDDPLAPVVTTNGARISTLEAECHRIGHRIDVIEDRLASVESLLSEILRRLPADQ